MVEQLFGSKTRVKLLKLFYSNPNRSFYVREITRKIDEQINSVRRELANLQSVGLINSDNTDNRVYYEVDQKYEYYQPLLEIFGAKKRSAKAKHVATPDEADESTELKGVGNVELAILTGQFTRDETSGVDLLLVGNLNKHAVLKYVDELEAKEGKELRFTTMSLADFKYRLQIKDRFVSNILLAKKQVLVDKSELLS